VQALFLIRNAGLHKKKKNVKMATNVLTTIQKLSIPSDHDSLLDVGYTACCASASSRKMSLDPDAPFDGRLTLLKCLVFNQKRPLKRTLENVVQHSLVDIQNQVGRVSTTKPTNPHNAERVAEDLAELRELLKFVKTAQSNAVVDAHQTC